MDIPSSFDCDVERATSLNNTSEEWKLIMEICDRASGSSLRAKECLHAILRRLAHPDLYVQSQATTLLDACVTNCGRNFHLEMASEDFEIEFRRLLSRVKPTVATRLRAMVRQWAEGEFRDDPQLDVIPALHAKMCVEASDPQGLASASPPSPGSVAAYREREDLERAIALSLRDVSARPEPPFQARVINDFEAAEDNELTFAAGEIVHVTDSSDPNWWKGYNSRGEGLFPAHFVTREAEVAEVKNPVENSTTEEIAEVAGTPGRDIDEAEMDAVLVSLHEADPTVEGSDEARLAARTSRVLGMGAVVDAALEQVDTRHSRLTQLSTELVDALNLYHEMMRAPAPAPPPPPPMPPTPTTTIHGPMFGPPGGAHPP